MRTRIKVMDLTLAQWDWLQTNMPVSFDMAPDAVRMCVEFELTPDFSTTHVEMPVRAFMTLMERLALVGMKLEPVTLPKLPTAEQVRNLSAKQAADLAASMNSSLVDETPSVFPGAPPIRTYADGSQTYGPYAQPVEDVDLPEPEWDDLNRPQMMHLLEAPRPEPYGYDQDGNVVALDQDGNP